MMILHGRIIELVLGLIGFTRHRAKPAASTFHGRRETLHPTRRIIRYSPINLLLRLNADAQKFSNDIFMVIPRLLMGSEVMIREVEKGNGINPSSSANNILNIIPNRLTLLFRILL